MREVQEIKREIREAHNTNKGMREVQEIKGEIREAHNMIEEMREVEEIKRERLGKSQFSRAFIFTMDPMKKLLSRLILFPNPFKSSLADSTERKVGLGIS